MTRVGWGEPISFIRSHCDLSQCIEPHFCINEKISLMHVKNLEFKTM
jgi:hypothetical protein